MNETLILFLGDISLYKKFLFPFPVLIMVFQTKKTLFLRYIARMNGRYPAKFREEEVYDYHASAGLDKEEEERQRQGSIKDLVKWPGLRRNFLAMCFCWLSFSMGYFGLMYNMPARQGSVYLVFVLPSIFHMVTLPLYPYFQVQ